MPQPAPKVAGFEPIDLPPVKLGLDVVTPEGDLPEGAVRVATNVLFHDGGGFDRRPGYEAFAALAGAHSLWQGASGSYAAANGSLYAFDGSLSSIYSGLPPEDPVEYAEIGLDLYFTVGGVLRQYAEGAVRWPGVAYLLGEYPTLTATTGSMRSGRYGVAYSLVNDLGVESGLSSTAFVSGTGILVSGIVGGTDVAQMKIYATHADGEQLYLYQTLTWATSASVLDATRGVEADKVDLIPLPGGEIVRELHGRLYVAFDVWLFYSPTYAPGLTHVHDGYMTFGKPITMLEAVAGGLYVGFADGVVFLRGTGPEDFVVTPTPAAGAIPTSFKAKADNFTPEISAGNDVAVWLSPYGVAIGRADGSVVSPQSSRIRLTADSARGAVLLQQGVRQIVFAADGLTLLSPDDDTTLAYIAAGVGAAAGHGTGAFTGVAAVSGSIGFAGSAGFGNS